MFDDLSFTFELPARPAALANRALAPGDTSSPSAPPPLRRTSSANFEIASTSRLASRFYKSQPLRDDISSSYIRYSLPNTPPTWNDEGLLTINHWRSPSAPASPRLLSHPPPRICHRLQQQINTQLLSTQSQLTAMDAMLEDLISSDIQREIRAPSPPPLPSPQPGELTEAPTSSAIPEDTALSAPSSPVTSVIPTPLPPSTSEEVEIDMPLEVDEGFEDGDDEELDMAIMLQNFRRAQDQPSLRKLGYSSATVVYNRPRMRKKISRRKRGDEII